MLFYTLYFQLVADFISLGFISWLLRRWLFIKNRLRYLFLFWFSFRQVNLFILPKFDNYYNLHLEGKLCEFKLFWYKLADYQLINSNYIFNIVYSISCNNCVLYYKKSHEFIYLEVNCFSGNWFSIIVIHLK